MDFPSNNHDRKLKVGVLGSGPISQFTHFECCRNARNVELTTVCDMAPDLLARAALLWQPKRHYQDHQKIRKSKPLLLRQ